MNNDEFRMTKSERSLKPEIRKKRQSPVAFDIQISDLIRHSAFVIYQSSFLSSFQPPIVIRHLTHRTCQRSIQTLTFGKSGDRRLCSAEPVSRNSPIVGTLRPTVGTSLPGLLSGCNSQSLPLPLFPRPVGRYSTTPAWIAGTHGNMKVR